MKHFKVDMTNQQFKAAFAAMEQLPQPTSGKRSVRQERGTWSDIFSVEYLDNSQAGESLKYDFYVPDGYPEVISGVYRGEGRNFGYGDVPILIKMTGVYTGDTPVQTR